MPVRLTSAGCFQESELNGHVSGKRYKYSDGKRCGGYARLIRSSAVRRPPDEPMNAIYFSFSSGNPNSIEVHPPIPRDRHVS